jgi:nicotinate phosphoribosyltransferase
MKYKPIINSILDDDQYKFAMQNYVFNFYPGTIVSHKFNNRGHQRFNKEFLIELQNQINNLSNLKLTEEEYVYLKENLPYLSTEYIDYLKHFRYNPASISIKLTKDNNLELIINDLWINSILLEVPLMAIISELYFKIIDTNWNYNNQDKNTFEKIKMLSENECQFADFGSRRRRSFYNQDSTINSFSSYNKNYKNSTFNGTSNVYFAKKYNLKAVGSIAHEIIMAESVLSGLRNANYFAMKNWRKVFKNNLGVFLPDTYGTDACLNNFSFDMAYSYKGLRWDSGDAFEFTDKVINFYKKIEINPMSKLILYSDNLSAKKCIDIKKYCKNKIQCAFGIGTHFTNQGFENSPPLNMVIKLNSVFHNGLKVPVVKLSDSKGKNMGDSEALRVAKYTFFNKSLYS